MLRIILKDYEDPKILNEVKNLKVVTAEQMREIDGRTINEYGVPGIVLMENACINIVKEIEKDIGTFKKMNIVVFAGTGNNGGDALGVARHVFNQGANVLVVLLGKEDSVKGEALINFNIIKKMGINFVVVEDESYNEEIAASLHMADVVVDGIFGTGINKNIDGFVAEIIDMINKANRYTTSIDIPSGVNATSGEIFGVCVKAVKTFALGFPKLGTIIGEGSKFAGKVEIQDIGIPKSIIEEDRLNICLLTTEYISKLIPRRSQYAHKGDSGKVLVIAGSTGLTGAAVLASHAAQRSGAGLVTLGIPETLNNIMEVRLTEEMTLPLADIGDGRLSYRCIEKLKNELNKFDVIAYGPGLGRGSDIYKITEWLLHNSSIPMIIDSDGINSLAGNIDLLSKAVCPVILTPHMGEMARLTGLSIENIQKDRINVLKEYCDKYKCTIVLKDWRTVVCTNEGHIYINTTGNQGMASGGTGDVLTGIIASFAGRGMSPEDSATAGVYVHGVAGDLTALEKSMEGMIAGDIVENLPYALKNIVGIV